ncbi:hypothetical protein [Verrucosispora sp. WMMD1129]|uniref:hypothetical protein n=1 Tax=Verrucosispora sp. WMMD1129 TaxID=3016093 RepID=UPI00249B09C8|nr:hypothetical protein [Verrucosispora sp. WMMD1129]WFE47114.1 hypothetical protein O7624_23670 [Verrucosispora sp. WMMD1129]
MVYFSEQFGIDYQKSFEWFDPILEVDTLLFIDPFLLFADKAPEWNRAHDRVMDYFNDAFVMLAESGLKKSHQKYRRVLTLMEFPEPEEFRLGFTRRGTRGSGSGKGLANQVTSAMVQAIRRGVDDIRHFEELGIFVERFNRDRISDVICNLLKPAFIEYTQAICKSHQVEMQEVEIDHSVFDSDRMRWMKAKWLLPVDPQTNEPIILAPKRFLRELPTLDAGDWYDSLDTSLRDDWNLKVSREMNKADILAAARQHIDSFRAWISRKEESTPQPYDVDVDPKLYVQWQRIVREAVADSTIAPAVITSDEQMIEFVKTAMEYVRHFCESARGWELFWEIKGEKSIPEPNMQILIYGLVKAYCNAAQVSFDREVETGRGPVDFVFTGDRRIRVIMEAKKLNHGEFWGGLESQTPIYAEGLQVNRAIYLAIRNSTSRAMNKRWVDLDRIASRASQAKGISITVERVDVMPRLSASDSHRTDYAPAAGEPDDAEP